MAEFSFAGRTALVTGGSSGIGLEIAAGLARCGARVLLPVRDQGKGSLALARILREAPGADLQLLDLDLASLESTRALVEMLRERGAPIELLVLNAGIVQLGERRRSVTADGFELAFQTNFLSHAVLTQGLLPLLEAGRARIAVQSSLGAAGARIPWGDLRGDLGYRPFRAYRASKVALGLLACELARRSTDSGWGIGVQLCHPGVAPGSAIAPALRALLPEALVAWAATRIGNPPRIAAQTALAALAADPSPVPRMFVPAGPLQLAGPPREAAPFASLNRPGEARLLWGQVARVSGTA
ncbi:MAG: SDR family NAD(P)-dependent oxidoreductase [Leucobacter sp.]